MAAVTGALSHKKSLSAGNLEPFLTQPYNFPFNMKDAPRSVGLQMLCSRRSFFAFCNSFFTKYVDSSCKLCLLVSPEQNRTD